jgi:hypothetical protein
MSAGILNPFLLLTLFYHEVQGTFSAIVHENWQKSQPLKVRFSATFSPMFMGPTSEQLRAIFDPWIFPR